MLAQTRQHGGTFPHVLKSDIADLVFFLQCTALTHENEGCKNGEDAGRVECAESRSQLRVCGVNDGAIVPDMWCISGAYTT